MAQDAIINRWDINGDVYEIQDAGRGHPLGVATLDENGIVPDTQLPDSIDPVDVVEDGNMHPVTSNAVYYKINKNKFLIPSPLGATKYYKLTNNTISKVGNVYIGNRYCGQILVRPSGNSAKTDILRLNNYDTNYSIKACKMGTDSNNKGVFLIKIGNYNPTAIINLDDSNITLESITETDWNNATSSTLTNYREYLDITTAPTIAPTNVVETNNLNVITSGGVYDALQPFSKSAIHSANTSSTYPNYYIRLYDIPTNNSSTTPVITLLVGTRSNRYLMMINPWISSGERLQIVSLTGNDTRSVRIVDCAWFMSSTTEVGTMECWIKLRCNSSATSFSVLDLSKVVDTLKIKYIGNDNASYSGTTASAYFNNIANKGTLRLLDTTPTVDSVNLITSGAVFSALSGFLYRNNTSSSKTIKISNMYPTEPTMTNVYSLSARNGEFGILSCGTTDGSEIVAPEFFRLATGTTKIGNIYYKTSDKTVIITVGAYTHFRINQINGSLKTISTEEVTSTSGYTAITRKQVSTTNI